ncbi:hypothetical protein V9T40_003416 [Parthenolecanium corni]|uniref:Cas12f1-like TNB domain-containing protein n=1 Tax=Parthenolecanium corni TaxID=536013 RepID=A0AAN9TT43_9HEMI
MSSFSRKRKKKDEFATSTIKCALASKLCPLYEKRDELLGLIREDALAFTKFHILYSYKVYAFYSHYLTKYAYRPDKFYALYPKPEFSKLLSMCKTKSTKVPDEDGVFEPIENLDSKLRTFSQQYIRSQYETNFLESFTRYLFARLKRCIYNLPEFKARKIDGRKQFPKSKREIHAELSASYYKGEPSDLLKRFPTLPHAGIKDLQKEPWRYVHAFFRVQNFLVDLRAKSFCLFPVARVEHKHCVYDARALQELARRLEPANIREPEFYWSATKKKTIGGKEAYSKYSAKNFFFDTREYKRRAYSKRKTEKLENEFNADVKDKNPNLKDCRQYANTSKFYEYWFAKRWKVYVEDNKLVRNQTLDRYLRMEKAYEKIITKLFPKEEGGGKTLILYGKGSEFMNVSNFRLKGCAKFSHDSLLKKMREKIFTVEMANEAYTSQTCAHCREEKGELKFVKMPAYGFKRHRYVFCQECHRNANRDYNGAKNIYLLNTTSIGSLVKTSSRYVPRSGADVTPIASVANDDSSRV